MLDLSSNNLTALPQSIHLPPNLIELDLGGNKLTEVPQSIRPLKKLRFLRISSNQLTTLPEWLHELPTLRELRVNGNQLKVLPEIIQHLSQLTVLNVGNNGLTTLPDWLSTLTSLRKLMVHANRLTALPESIDQLVQLTTLYVDDNSLTSLPESIGNLSNLDKLDLSNNKLTALPRSLTRLENLTQLFLHGNQALGLPSEILGATYDDALTERTFPADPYALLDYYFRTQQAQRPLNEARLILVGRGGVGKTSLVNRLLRNTFMLGEIKTEGIQISSWSLRLNDDDARLHVWDFGGQEILHATHQFFLSQRSLYLLVLSGREGTEDQDADYWLRMIDSFGAGSPVIVVLNKSQEHLFDVNRRALKSKYPDIHAFIRTDCSDGTGIDELRKIIQQTASQLENLRVAFPASWFEIKNKLSTSSRNYLSYEEFRKFCLEYGEKDPNAQEALAGYLHQLGVALNYKDDPRLQDTHVLDPLWVTDGIYKLLSSPLLAEQHGELGLGDVAKLLDPESYPRSMHRFLLDLMKKFELCFTFPDNDARYLIPELLDKQEPPEAADFPPEECLNFQYHYPVIPEGLLPRFIVRTHALSEGLHRWRTGVILQFEGNRALVKADPADKKVFISVSGPVASRRRLLAVIRADFEHIHRDIRKLEPLEMVPIPGHPETVIPYAELQVFEQNGMTEIPKVIGNRVVNLKVQEFLNGVDLPTLAAESRSRSGKEREPAEAPVQLFISYSHKDELLRNQLETHLKLLQRQKLLSTWHERKIDAGEERAEVLAKQLDQAEVILLLVSADYLASENSDAEMHAALERHQAGKAVVIPVILRDVNWDRAPFAKLEPLPTNKRPVTRWPDRDSAWRDVSEGIERVIEGIRKRRQRH
jgi:internalin A